VVGWQLYAKLKNGFRLMRQDHGEQGDEQE
jgi:hypothetical protein